MVLELVLYPKSLQIYMSIPRPRIPRPSNPKIKKPSILKRKRIVKKLPSITKKTVQPRISSTKSITKKRVTRKPILGNCFINKNCKGILARKVSKSQCRDLGGKSWKKTDGHCQNL